MLVEAGCEFSLTAIRRWLRLTATPIHHEWLAAVRDYTMYINLHVQIRPEWYNQSYIMADIRRLFARTRLPDPTSQRVRSLRAASAVIPMTLPLPLPTQQPILGLLGLPLLPFQDVSGGMGYDVALQLIQQALFRM
jgi:hypothetical protein